MGKPVLANGDTTADRAHAGHTNQIAAGLEIWLVRTRTFVILIWSMLAHVMHRFRFFTTHARETRSWVKPDRKLDGDKPSTHLPES